MKSNFNDKLTIQQRLILPIILLGADLHKQTEVFANL